MVVSAGVNGDRMPHHPCGHCVGKADMNGANGPGMAQVIGGQRQPVTAELFGNAPPHLLKRGLSQISLDLWEVIGCLTKPLKSEVLHPVRLEGPDLMLAGFRRRQHTQHPITSWRQGGEIAEEHFMVAQPVGGHQSIGESPARIRDQHEVVQDLAVTGKLAEARLM